jgi:DNA-binding MarR family transcriptional regulator
MADVPCLDDQLCFALYAASRAMTNAYAPILAELELTYPQYLAMMVLWEQDGQRVSAIGERLHLDSATLTPLLKRLEQTGYLERKRSTEDERVVEVFLTAAGKKLRNKAREVPACMIERAGMSLQELLALRDQLVGLTANLRAD